MSNQLGQLASFRPETVSTQSARTWIRLAHQAGLYTMPNGNGEFEESILRFVGLIGESDRKDAERYRWLRETKADPRKFDEDVDRERNYFFEARR